ncbi:MAG: tyrosine-protein phosphatase [Gammaproteobacteria bacterium]|nr:tyrosine-protein phosphatase [Gammaproteobacteria bacterium]
MNKCKKIILSLLIILGLALLIIYYLFMHNFSIVIPGQVYRTRELSQTQFERVIQQYHIKTVINLRGPHPQQSWYQHEISASKKMDIQHDDICLSSYTLPEPKVLEHLVNILEQAKYPILIHCNSGVDRTGLGAMISVILDKNMLLSDAEKQVSWRYFVFRNDSIGKRILSMYKKWLFQNNLPHSTAHFLHWVKNSYGT